MTMGKWNDLQEQVKEGERMRESPKGEFGKVLL